MKGKNLVILLVAVAVLGAVWYFSAKSNQSSWSQSGEGGGTKVAKFPINDVARINIKSSTGELNVVRKADDWVVQERADYPANYDQVSGLLRKLQELKTVQEVKVGASQLPRLELVEPGKGDSAGTLVQLYGADGKPLEALLLGKKQMRKGEGGEDPFGGGMSAGFATGRYVKPVAGAKVSLVSDPLEDADPKPERWLAKDFLKIENPKSIEVKGSVDAGDQKPAIVPTQPWSVTRENATAEWKLTDAKPEEKLDTGKVAGLSGVFSSANFSDVLAPGAKLEEPITTAVIETFDGFKYELKIGKAVGENQPVLVTVTGNFPKDRTIPASEKPEDKQRLDDEFTAKQKANEEKLAKEKKFEGRPYLVAKFSVEALLKDRAGLLADKPAEPVKPTEPALPGTAPLVPGIVPNPLAPPVGIKPAAPVKPALPIATPKPAATPVPLPTPVKPAPAAATPAPAAPPVPATTVPAPEKPAEPTKPVEPAKAPEAPKPADPAPPLPKP